MRPMYRNIDQKRNEELRAIEDPALAQLYISVMNLLHQMTTMTIYISAA